MGVYRLLLNLHVIDHILPYMIRSYAMKSMIERSRYIEENKVVVNPFQLAGLSNNYFVERYSTLIILHGLHGNK